MLNIDMMNDNRVAQELIDEVDRQQKSDMLIPAGTWEGVLVSYQEREGQTDPTNKTYGHKVYTTNWQLYDVEGRTRTLNYVDVCPSMIKGQDGRIDMRTVLAAQIAKAAGKGGAPITEAFDMLKVTRVKLKVTISKADESRKREPRNWVNAIYAV